MTIALDPKVKEANEIARQKKVAKTNYSRFFQIRLSEGELEEWKGYLEKNNLRGAEVLRAFMHDQAISAKAS